MRKICCAFCAAVLLMTLCIPARATEGPAFAVSAVTAAAGERVEITVSLVNNPGIASAKLEVSFPVELTLESVSYGTDLGGTTMEPQSLTSPVSLNWISPLEELSGDVIYATLTFALSEEAAAGEYPVTLTYDPNNVFNMAEENVSFAVKNGGVTVPGGEQSTGMPSGEPSAGDNPNHGDPILWTAIGLTAAGAGTAVVAVKRKKK